jgi:hypothetical protein
MRSGVGLAVVTSAVLAASCSTGRVNERVAYWTTITAEQVRPGSTLDAAQGVLSAHGLQLQCCVSGPDNKQSYFALEKDVGRFFFTVYSVAVIVNISRDNLVEEARVERWGVGL